MADASTPPESSPTASVTDARYQKLRATLESLFELDKADLDFGIYRLMAARNSEVQAFLDRQLKEVVRRELGHEAGADAARLAEQIEAEVARLTADGIDPDQSKTVQRLRKQQAESGTMEELEGRVYGHLSAFFSRYYDGGDFISQRRYGKDAYAIPYDGREVVLHWANKDQHYIKSGESHRNYAFRVPKPGGGGEHRFRFTVVDATVPADNNKAGKSRFYVPTAEGFAGQENGERVFRFEHRPLTDAEREALGATANQQEATVKQLALADAEARVLAAATEAEREALTTPAPTGKREDRTLLAKHLEKYVARNDHDYFIHKDLRGFLSRELDHYLKTEVLHLDDVVDADPDHLAKVQGLLRATRKVATAVIDFVSGIEEFQKKLWLKKKLVLQTRWVVSLRLVKSEELLERVAACKAVWAHWEELGFRPDGAEGWGTRAWLDAHDGLVLDTGVIEAADPGWTAAFLATVDDLDEATTGTLVHGENFNALNLLETRYRGEVKCVYIDPPYNTEADRAAGKFLYKDGYDHSSWITMLSQVDAVAYQLVNVNDFAKFTSLDETEIANAIKISTIGKFHGIFTWRRTRTGGHLSNTFNQLCDYVLVTAPATGQGSWLFGGRADPEESQPLFKSSNKPKKLTFPAGSIFFKDLENGTIAKADPTSATSLEDDVVVQEHHNVAEVSVGGPFVWQQSMLDYELGRGSTIIVKKHKSFNPRFLREAEDHKPLPSLADESFMVGTNEDASDELNQLLPDGAEGLYPKPTRLVSQLISTKSAFDSRLTVLDYFAGSGTTALAVISLNREDNGTRKFLLVEMGEYFETVLVPRVMKVMYGPDWKDGHATTHDAPQPGLVKVFAIESYDDALENLPERGDGLLSGAAEADEPLLRYLLDLEAGPRIADTAAFAQPWSATLRARNPHGDGTAERPVDLVETFNLLLGLRVRHHGRVRRYAAEFVTSNHPEHDGRLEVDGKLRRDDDGPFAFQRIEGDLADGSRVLVVWRELTGDAERDDAALRAHLADEAKREADAGTRPFQRVYVNGSCTLNQPAGGETRQFYSTEEAFRNAMFEVAEAEAADRG